MTSEMLRIANSRVSAAKVSATGTRSKFRVPMLILCNPTLERWRIYGSE